MQEKERMTIGAKRESPQDITQGIKGWSITHFPPPMLHGIKVRMPREQAVVLTKRDFRLLPKSQLDALMASSDRPSSFFGRPSTRSDTTQSHHPSAKAADAPERPENSICFDLTYGPRLEPKPAPGFSPKPPTSLEKVGIGSYSTPGTLVPRQVGVTRTAVDAAASSRTLQEMGLHEQLSRLRSATTSRSDLFDGGHDAILAVLESLQVVYTSIPVELEALKCLAGTTLQSAAAAIYFDTHCSSSPRFATAPAGTCRSLERLTDYVATTQSSPCTLPLSAVSHKMHAIAVEDELAVERERLRLLELQFEVLQSTLRRYEKQAAKNPAATSSGIPPSPNADPQLEPSDVMGHHHHQQPDKTDALSASHAAEQRADSRLNLALQENARLRAVLADRDDVISRQGNEIMYLQEKCNDLQKLLSQNMDTTLDFAIKYKQTLERTSGHVSPMLLDGKTAEQVAWQSNLDIAKMLGMPLHGIPTVPVSGTDRRQSTSTNTMTDASNQGGSNRQQPGASSTVGTVVLLDHVTPAQRLEAMQQTTQQALALIAKTQPT